MKPIVIIGGGPAGCAAAIELARLNHPVMLIERSRYEGPRIGETVPPSARPLLRELGVPEVLPAQMARECYGIRSIWGSAEEFDKDFIFSPYGHGWHVDRSRFDEALFDVAQEHGAVIYRDSSVKSCRAVDGPTWEVAIERPSGRESLTACAIIDASGRSAWLARRLASSRVVHDRQIAIAAIFGQADGGGLQRATTVESAASKAQCLTAPQGDGGELQCVTTVESAENGWWYSAPLPQSGVVVVYLTDSDLSRRAGANSLAQWLQLLSRTSLTRARVRNLPSPDRLRLYMADTYRIAMEPELRTYLNVGAAAIGLDPLSSAGIWFALRSGREAARALAESRGGDERAISRYADFVDTYFEDYLDKRSMYYRSEGRWATSPFWQRRHQPRGVGFFNRVR
jgi:flavin-dependent dehydrogenase